MTLNARTTALASAIGADVGQLNTRVDGFSRQFTSVTALLADTAAPATFVEGSTITTQLEGFIYTVAATTATDQHVTTAGGAKLYVSPDKDGYVNMRAYGLVENGDLKPLLNTALLSQNPRCIIDVDCVMNSGINAQVTRSGAIKGIGKPSVTFTGGYSMLIEGAVIVSTTLSSDANAGTNVFTVANATGINIGDHLEIRSGQTGLDGPSAVKKACYTVAGVLGAEVITHQSSPWDYITASGTIDVKARKPNSFELSGLSFTKTTLAAVIYCRLDSWVAPKIFDCHQDAGYLVDDVDDDGINFGLTATNCVGGGLYNCSAYGMYYPYNHNYCRGYKIRDVNGYKGGTVIDCTGAISPVWDGVTGEDNIATLGIHTSIDAQVRNVVALRETGGMNLRGIGFIIENVEHSYVDSITFATVPTNIYALSRFVNEASARDMSEYSATFINVKSKPNANGVQAYVGTEYTHQPLIVRDCNVHKVQGYGDNVSGGSLSITDTTLNKFKWRGGPVRINRCDFVGSAVGDADTYAMGFPDLKSSTALTQDVTLFVSDTKFDSYAKVCNIDYSQYQGRRFNNCQFSKITGTIANPQTDNTGTYYFNGCTLIDVVAFSTNTTPTTGMNFNFCKGYGTTPAIP